MSLFVLGPGGVVFHLLMVGRYVALPGLPETLLDSLHTILAV